MKQASTENCEPDSSLLDRIQFLVDNELTVTERTQLFADLDKTKNGWRACAVSFCDEQFLQFELGNENATTAEDNPKVKTGCQPPANRRRGMHSYLVIALSLLIGLLVGLMAASRKPNSVAGPQQSDGIVSSWTTIVEEAKTLVRGNRQMQEKSIDLPYTRLFELENTENHVVYLSPDPLPEFILQSLIFAEHDVHVTRENIDSKVVGDRTMKIPVYEIRVNKNQRYSQVSSTNKL